VLRKRAIRSLLVEEVAGLRLPHPGKSGKPGESGDPDDPASEVDPAELELRDQREALEKAEKKALFAVGLDWIALVVLFVLRDTSGTFLPAGPTIDTVFTLGVVAVAVHSGYRLGQREKYRAVRRAWEEMT
jgi:hypothetical protein